MDVAGDVRIEPSENGVAVVVLTGEHDLGSLPRVQDAFDAVAGEGKSILIDLCPTSFVDSSILGAILDARRSAIESSRGFAVACDGSSEPVRRVLEVTGLSKELPVLPSREHAMADLGGQGAGVTVTAKAGVTELRLGLAAKADNLALVRQALAGLADGAGIGEIPLSDLKQIATEACMNAVVHAYPGGSEGRIDVTATATGRSVELRVRDWGIGFKPRPADTDTSLRLGLPLIAAMADSFQIASPPSGGTELIAFVLTGTNGDGDPSLESPAIPREAELAISAGSAAKPVIARVLAIAASRAGFSMDRVSDGILIGDAIAAGEAGDFDSSSVGIEIEECGPSLAVRVGPFVNGGAERMLERMRVPGLGVSITKLASRFEVVKEAGDEYLAIEIAAEPAASADTVA